MAKAKFRVVASVDPDRSIRFDVRLDMREATDAQKAANKLPAVEIKMRGGSITPAQARAILDILTDGVA